MNRERIIWSIILLIAIVYVGYRVANGGMGLGYEQRINGTVAPGSSWDVLAGSAEVSLSRTIGVWVAALFTLFVLSFVYRDNPFYKVAESIFIGVSAAYWMVVGAPMMYPVTMSAKTQMALTQWYSRTGNSQT